MFLWNPVSYLALLLCRRFSVRSKPDKLGCSYPVSIGVCPLLVDPGAPQLPLSAALIHRLLPVATSGFSAHFLGLPSSRLRRFGPQSDYLQGNLRPLVLPAVPPGPSQSQVAWDTASLLSLPDWA